MKRIFTFTLILLLALGITACNNENNSKETEDIQSNTVTEEGNLSLKGTDVIKYKFQEPLEDEFVESVEKIYLKENNSEDESTSVIVDENIVSDEDITLSPVEVILNSDLVEVNPSEEKTYQLALVTSNEEQKIYNLNIANIRPMDFTIRLLDSEGNIELEKVYPYEEFLKMANDKSYYTAGCVMHGLLSFKAEGIYLKDLFEDAGIDFHEGMSFATRVVDADEEIIATETNSSKETGEIFKNPNKYWIKPRYTDNYKMKYEDLYGKDNYFLTSPWEDKSVAEKLIADEGKFNFEVREALAKNPEYLIKVEPMIAVKSTSLNFVKDQRDIRSLDDSAYGRFANEVGFRFHYGSTLDNDPTVNLLAFDKDLDEYPVVENPENAGKIAIYEGVDPCGNVARQAQFVFGIDVFSEN